MKLDREQYGYYPEAHVWLMCMVLVYGITNFKPLLYIGVIPGISMGFYFYIQLIREARAMMRTLR